VRIKHQSLESGQISRHARQYSHTRQNRRGYFFRFKSSDFGGGRIVRHVNDSQ